VTENKSPLMSCKSVLIFPLVTYFLCVCGPDLRGAALFCKRVFIMLAYIESADLACAPSRLLQPIKRSLPLPRCFALSANCLSCNLDRPLLEVSHCYLSSTLIRSTLKSQLFQHCFLFAEPT